MGRHRLGGTGLVERTGPFQRVGGDRPWRHGGGLPMPGPRPGPTPGRQGAAREVSRLPGHGAALHRGGAGLRSVDPSRRGPGPRAGAARRWPPLLHDETGGRTDAAGAARRPRHAGRRAAPLLAGVRADGAGGGLRPQSRRVAPRPEAAQRHGRRLRRSAGHGLGPGQGAPPRRRGRGRGRGRRPHRSHRRRRRVHPGRGR